MITGPFKLFEVGGTVVRVHPTFFLLLAWAATVYWRKGGPQEAVYGVVFIIILFACVVLSPADAHFCPATDEVDSVGSCWPAVLSVTSLR